MIECAWLVLRAAGLILTLRAAGAALFLAAFMRSLPAQQRELRALSLRAGGAALAVVALQLLIEPVRAGGEWAASVDRDVLRLTLGSAGVAALLARCAGLACLWLAAVHKRGAVLLGAGLALCVGSFALTGHTVSHQPRPLLAALLLMHVAVVTFWFGALAPLNRILKLAPAAEAARALQAFSRYAVALVPVIGVVGAALAALLLPDAAALLTPYGLLLLAKVALFMTLLLIAARNRLRLLPDLVRGTMHAAVRLRRSIALESVLITTVLAVTALMTGFFSPD